MIRLMSGFNGEKRLDLTAASARMDQQKANISTTLAQQLHHQQR
eukprot:COSAG05_NODE_4_length_49189_cov_157.128784_23_plen_44_part_00